MTQCQLIDLLIARLIRDHGGSRQLWRRLVGPVRLYSEQTHSHCNWALSPSGNPAQIRAIEQLLDDIRLTHPIILADR
jgi:hypothetical protein